MITCVSFNRDRIGFRSKMLGFVWYPRRRPRVLYAWLKIGPWLWGRYGMRRGYRREVP